MAQRKMIGLAASKRGKQMITTHVGKANEFVPSNEFVKRRIQNSG